MYSNHAHIHKYRITNNFQILTSHNRKWFVPKPRDLTLCLLNYERQLSWMFVRKHESIKAVLTNARCEGQTQRPTATTRGFLLSTGKTPTVSVSGAARFNVTFTPNVKFKPQKPLHVPPASLQPNFWLPVCESINPPMDPLCAPSRGRAPTPGVL